MRDIARRAQPDPVRRRRDGILGLSGCDGGARDKNTGTRRESLIHRLRERDGRRGLLRRARIVGKGRHGTDENEDACEGGARVPTLNPNVLPIVRSSYPLYIH